MARCGDVVICNQWAVRAQGQLMKYADRSLLLNALCSVVGKKALLKAALICQTLEPLDLVAAAEWIARDD
jgi:hypothetical protein